MKKLLSLLFVLSISIATFAQCKITKIDTITYAPNVGVSYAGIDTSATSVSFTTQVAGYEQNIGYAPYTLIDGRYHVATSGTVIFIKDGYRLNSGLTYAVTMNVENYVTRTRICQAFFSVKMPGSYYTLPTCAAPSNLVAVDLGDGRTNLSCSSVSFSLRSIECDYSWPPFN